MSPACAAQNSRCRSGTATLDPVLYGGTPRVRSAASNPNEINGQHNQDCDPVPGWVTGGDHPPVQTTQAGKRTVREPIWIWSAFHGHRLGKKILTPLALETPHPPGINGAINHQMGSLCTQNTLAELMNPPFWNTAHRST